VGQRVADQRAADQRAAAAREDGIQADWDELVHSLQHWQLDNAKAARARARGRVPDAGPADLLQRVQQMDEILGLADRLDEIRAEAAAMVDGDFDYASADRSYAALFRQRGLADEGEDAALVGARIHGSPLREQLVASLDDWAAATRDRARRAWLLEAARQAQPGEWSDRFRDPTVWDKPAALEQLAQEANVADLSPHLLAVLARLLRGNKADAVPLLTAAQQRHPEDFWLNFGLGNALRKAQPDEALGYFRAALALRPGCSAVYYNLGNVLKDKKRMDAARACFEGATQLDPTFAFAHNNLGLTLYEMKRLDDAIPCFERAIQLDPKGAKPHNNLGNVLVRQGKLDEAIREYRAAIGLDAGYALAHNGLGLALFSKGQPDEAIASFRNAIDIDPNYPNAHFGLGLVQLRLGRIAEARAATQRALDLLPTDDPLRKIAEQQLEHCERMLARPGVR
jgi:serine/threonine-protein kinase